MPALTRLPTYGLFKMILLTKKSWHSEKVELMEFIEFQK